MPDVEIAPPEAPEADEAQPQEGTPDAGQPAVDPAVKELRREAQSLRTRLREAEAKVKEYEASQLTEQERLARELEELRTERDALREEASRSRALEAATKAGAVHPDLIADRLRGVDFSSAKAVEAAVTELRKQYPRLFNGPGSADGGQGRASAPTTDMNTMIRRAAGRA